MTGNPPAIQAIKTSHIVEYLSVPATKSNEEELWEENEYQYQTLAYIVAHMSTYTNTHMFPHTCRNMLSHTCILTQAENGRKILNINQMKDWLCGQFTILPFDGEKM